ncbi:NAD(P)/FAD-dependent oxidoreductase [Aquabacterium sp. A7-Y]|uniref:flavin-containing monooxygenase n=1 Tax=Aquabacterium sp. A7-Y TaxID=1349605 RepID=UPI00223E3FD4|nr:NAD(P)/FAD-dependent oxidoreductase [Aquabacterium sp. A7-Y]MCW7541031.1 NAD(P)/FAD-dependent oxidoreductase [Aquabacterium sp. A7-Y]
MNSSHTDSSRLPQPLPPHAPASEDATAVPADGRCRVAIIGAGPAGLATAASLAQRGIDSVLFESSHHAGQGWRHHYQRLHLHTARALSGLPGMAIPRESGRWVAAQDFAAYLERYAEHHRCRIALQTPVVGLRRQPHGWELRTSRGCWQAAQVVVATGLNRCPHVPAWPGREFYRGELLHSSRYRTAEPFWGRDVLVVGTGNSGAEIACDLAAGGASRVSLSVRTGPNVLPRSILGLPTQVLGLLFASMPTRLMDPMVRVTQWLTVGDLRRFGMPPPPRGLFSQVLRDRAAPIIDVGLVEQLKRRRVEVVAAVDSFDAEAVRLADGKRIRPEVVVAATGYRPGLEPLLGHLVALDDDGLPRLSRSCEALDAPGLYFPGYVVSLGGVLHEIARQSRRVAASIAAAPDRTLTPTTTSTTKETT